MIKMLGLLISSFNLWMKALSGFPRTGSTFSFLLFTAFLNAMFFFFFSMLFSFFSALDMLVMPVAWNPLVGSCASGTTIDDDDDIATVFLILFTNIVSG